MRTTKHFTHTNTPCPKTQAMLTPTRYVHTPTPCMRPHLVQAYDTKEMRMVAVKIHQLNSTWNEQKKQSYVKHAIREYDIHKSLRHPHIVSLIDILEIDVNTFATVLEYCDGSDLDAVLREHQVGGGGGG